MRYIRINNSFSIENEKVIHAAFKYTSTDNSYTTIIKPQPRQ